MGICEKEIKHLKYWHIYEVFNTCQTLYKEQLLKYWWPSTYTCSTFQRHWMKTLNRSEGQLWRAPSSLWVFGSKGWAGKSQRKHTNNLSLTPTWIKRNKDWPCNHTWIKDVLYVSTPYHRPGGQPQLSASPGVFNSPAGQHHVPPIHTGSLRSRASTSFSFQQLLKN